MTDNPFSKYFLLLIFPVLLFALLLFLRFANGEFYLNCNYDCSYAYLINSLNLAQAPQYNIGLYQHPGIPLESAGSVVIRLYYFFMGELPGIAGDVFNDPESYIFWITVLLLFFNCLALYFLGAVSLKLYNNLPLSLFLQLTMLSSIYIYDQLIYFKPESMLIFTIINFISLCLIYLNSENFSSKKIYYLIIGFSVICGLGMAVKINFLPFAVVPLLLFKGIKERLYYVLFAFLSFFVFVFPAIGQFKNFYYWIHGMIFRSGLYGSGSEEIINKSVYLNNVYEAIVTDTHFEILYFLIFIVLVSLFFKSVRTKITNKKLITLLAAVFIAMSLQILMVAKHYQFHYMTPALTIKFFAIVILVFVISDILNIRKDKLIFSVLFFIMSVISIYELNIYYQLSVYNRIEAEKTIEILDTKYKEAIVVPAYGSSSYEYGISFSTFFAGNAREDYNITVNKNFPGKIFYDKYKAKIYAHSNSTNIKKILLSGETIIFQGKDESDVTNFVNSVKEITGKGNIIQNKVYESGTGEFLYAVIL